MTFDIQICSHLLSIFCCWH